MHKFPPRTCCLTLAYLHEIVLSVSWQRPSHAA